MCIRDRVTTAPQRLTIEVGPSNTILVENFDPARYDEIPKYVEVRGIVKNATTLYLEDLNPFGDENFDLDAYNKAVEYYNSQYAHMCLQIIQQKLSSSASSVINIFTCFFDWSTSFDGSYMVIAQSIFSSV
eukprot:TRINITY_DN2393_c0_g1_i5.p2 TRINITY_DN2393_c0_g1~~TRINITY_DN2393_c0_g1_i5.p2  ORF type:complete len:131 (-),score=13.03 TRINITY_DN2393_c0_g1_i5:214-606(-)